MAEGNPAIYKQAASWSPRDHPAVILTTFVSSSAAWIYPVERYIARAIYGKWTLVLEVYSILK